MVHSEPTCNSHSEADAWRDRSPEEEEGAAEKEARGGEGAEGVEEEAKGGPVPVPALVAPALPIDEGAMEASAAADNWGTGTSPLLPPPSAWSCNAHTSPGNPLAAPCPP